MRLHSPGGGGASEVQLIVGQETCGAFLFRHMRAACQASFAHCLHVFCASTAYTVLSDCSGAVCSISLLRRAGSWRAVAARQFLFSSSSTGWRGTGEVKRTRTSSGTSLWVSGAHKPVLRIRVACVLSTFAVGAGLAFSVGLTGRVPNTVQLTGFASTMWMRSCSRPA